MKFDLIESLFNQVNCGTFRRFRLSSSLTKSIQRYANIISRRDTLNRVHALTPLVKEHQRHMLNFMSLGKAAPFLGGEISRLKLYIRLEVAFHAVEVAIESPAELAAWVMNLHHGWRAVANDAQVILYLLVAVISGHGNAHHRQKGCRK